MLRCGTSSPTGPSPIVVKRYPDTADGGAACAREVLGLAEIGSAPTLLGADGAHRVVVMEDFGHGSTLADLLLGDDRTQLGMARWTWHRLWAMPWGDAIRTRSIFGRCSAGRESRTGTRFSRSVRASTEPWQNGDGQRPCCGRRRDAVGPA